MPHPPALPMPTGLSDESRRRLGALVAVALIHLGLGLLLLSLAPPIVRQKIVDMAMFSVAVADDSPEAAAEAEPQQAPEQAPAPAPQPEAPTIETAAEVVPEAVPAPDVPRVAPAPQPQAAPTPPPVAAVIRPGRSFGPPDLRPRGAADIWADTERVSGSGPNGEPLYAARWVREPYDDELRGFLSTAIGPGWGLIACRTVPGNRVEDCIVLDEYPQGSRIARAAQAAAWQFLVHPPRIGGRPQVGEWVRIRIDYGMKPDGRAR